MPLAAAAAAMGPALAVAAGSVDPVGIVAWTAIAAAFCGGFPAFCSTFNPLGGTPCVAVGPLVLPGGNFVTLPGAPLGVLLAVAAGSIDAAGIAKWSAIGAELVTWMGTYGSYGPAGLIGFVTGLPPPGPVTGAGVVTFSNELIGPDLAAAAGSTDAGGIAKWTAIGAVILTAIKASGLITPTTMVNPGTGGPVAGVGTFT